MTTLAAQVQVNYSSVTKRSIFCKAFSTEKCTPPLTLVGLLYAIVHYLRWPWHVVTRGKRHLR